MKDNNTLPSVLTVIGIVVLIVILLSSGCEKKRPSTESQSAAAESSTEKVPRVKPAAQKAEQFIEEAQEALVELKKDAGVKKNTEELREVYKKLAEICSKAVKTQKNMLDAEYTTDTADKETKVFDVEEFSIAASSSPPPKLSSVTERISPDSDDRK